MNDPSSASVKESEFKLNENENIYDEIQSPFDDSGYSMTPELYVTPETTKCLQASSSSKQSSSSSSESGIGCNDNGPSSEPQYSYASARFGRTFQHTPQATPYYDDCISKPTASPAITPPCLAKPVTVMQAPVIHQPPAMTKSSTASVESPASQAEVREYAIITPQVNTRKSNSEDAKNRSLYFPLKTKTMQKQDTYEESFTVTTASKASGEGKGHLQPRRRKKNSDNIYVNSSSQ